MAEMPCPFCNVPLSVGPLGSCGAGGGATDGTPAGGGAGAGEPAGQPESCPLCRRQLVVCKHYRLRELVGRGGMGLVYGATRHPDGLRVAVKVVVPKSTSDFAALELFEHSSHVLMGLSHPGLPRVYAFERIEPARMILVREIFDGGSLEERIRQQHRRLSGPEVHDLLVSSLELLAYLQGLLPPVIHRDIKPANIMFRTPEDWRPVLVDFDTIAAIPDRQSGLTIVGTAGYTAPEQFAGDASPASDVYSLGATMLFVATHLDADQIPRRRGHFDLGKKLDGLAENTRQVLLRMVKPDVGDRYPDARHALEDLRAPREPAASATATAATATPNAATGAAAATTTGAGFAGLAGVAGAGARGAGGRTGSTANPPAPLARGAPQPLPALTQIDAAMDSLDGALTGAVREAFFPSPPRPAPAPTAAPPRNAAPLRNAVPPHDTAPSQGAAAPHAAGTTRSLRTPHTARRTPWFLIFVVWMAMGSLGTVCMVAKRHRAQRGDRSYTPTGTSPGTPAARRSTPDGLTTLYVRQCESGRASGCFQAGLRYSNGQGSTPRDQAKAAEYYQRACDNGEPSGCTNLGVLYEHGRGVGQDTVRAGALYLAACQARNATGCRNLAVFYRDGKGMAKDAARSLNLFEQACELRDMQGCHSVGVAYYGGNGVARDQARAAEYYQRACDGGYLPGCKSLGLLYARGEGVDKDEPRSFALFDRACKGGLEPGCFDVAYSLVNGRGVERNSTRAIPIYKRLCTGGDVAACNNLGLLYEKGDGVARNLRSAADIYQQACQGENMVACSNLGKLYEEGKGVAKDNARAASLYRQACAGRIEKACTRLAGLRKVDR